MLLAAVLALHLIPRPAQVEQPAACPASAAPLTAPAGFDPGALEELNERWRALGIGTVRAAPREPAISVTHDGSLPPQAYRLDVRAGRAKIESGGAEGTFYAAMTLAQLPRARGRRLARFRACRYPTVRRCSGGCSPTTFRAGRCRRCAISKNASARLRHSR